MSGLREQDDYADLAYEIGRLYWYYYDYGKTDTSDNQITRIKSSVQMRMIMEAKNRIII